MRAALDATPLLDRPTGVGAFCRGALSALALRRDVEVSAFAVSWRRRQRLADQLPEGVSWRQRPMPARPLHAAWRRTSVPPLEWFVGPTDVVHGTNFVVPPTRRAAAVVTVHDLTALRFPELCDRSTHAFPALVKRAHAHGAWIHTPSSFVAAEVVELLGADPDRVRAVHSGVPPVPAPPVGQGSVASAAADVEGGTSESPYVLAIGTAEPRKDLPGLVRAFDAVAAAHPALSLVLAGPPGWGSDALDEAVSASRVAGRIRRTGWLSDLELGRLLRSAAVLAYPSLYEGFGFPPLQAMSVGVPVVTSRSGALPEVVGDAALLVTPRDEESLAAALLAALEPGERRRLSDLGRERAKAFSWERCGEGLSALYGAAGDDRRSR